MGPEERESYGRLADGFEKWLIRLLVVLAVLLLAAQPLMRVGEIRRAVSETERAEGFPYGKREMQLWLDRHFGRESTFRPQDFCIFRPNVL